jgi:GTP-binding protein
MFRLNRYLTQATIRILGRANVGKSAIYNKLLRQYGPEGAQRALVSDRPGTTKDGKKFLASELGVLIKDTPAYEETIAVNSDVTLFVVDADEGVTPLDRRLAAALRQHECETILVANKSESVDQTSIIADLYELEVGDPVFLSACSSLGWAELAERFQAVLADRQEEPNEAAVEPEIGLALIGRPNTGKSSLFNALLRREEATTGDRPGTTSDALEVVHGKFVLMDTAGVSKKGGEEGAVSETRRTLRRADVVVVVMDAVEVLKGGLGLSRQEMRLGKEASELGKCVMVVVNKWDLVPTGKETLLRKAVEEKALTAFSQTKGMPIIFASAKTGLNVPLILGRAENLVTKWQKRIGTSELNAWLRAFVVHHPVPWKDKMLCHVKFITQVGTAPPTFVIYTNIHGEFPDNYLQLLKNTIREEFKLHGPPIVLLLRSTFVPKKVMKARKFAPTRKTEEFFQGAI